MKFQEAESSNRFDNDLKRKTRGVIILTDNRPRHTPQKATVPDFRESAFKCKVFSNTETEVDPCEAWFDIHIQHDQDQLLEAMNKKLLVLEQRVRQLYKSSQIEGSLIETVSPQKDKKSRRKFNQMERNYQCPLQECARIYGSQTSLRHHLKLKHKILQKENQESNQNFNKKITEQ